MAAWWSLETSLWLCALMLTCWELWIWWHSRHRLRELAARIPGPSPWPVVGNAPLFCRQPSRMFSTLLQVVERYGPTCRIWVGPKLYVVVTDPQDIACVLGSASVISRDSYINSIASAFMGNSLITSTGEVWKNHRKIITPALSYNSIQELVPDFVHHAEELNASFLELADGSTFDLFPYVATAILNTVCWTTMGAIPTGDSGAYSDHEYVRYLDRSIAIVQEKFIKPWYVFKWLYRCTRLHRDEQETLCVLKGFADAVIEARVKRLREAGDKDKGGKKVLLDQLLSASHNGRRMSQQEVRDEVNTLIAAGYETTATSVCFALLLLGMYPRVQDRVIAELESVFQDDKHRPATAADLRRLHYLDAVIKETLRLFPPAPIIHRELESAELKIGGCSLPVGASVLVVSYITHRNADHFDKPLHFCPERFEEGSERVRHPFAYLPFGVGPRACIGRTYGLVLTKTVLATVLRRFTVESRLGWQDLSRLGHGIVLKLEAGFPVELLPRRAEEKTEYTQRSRRSSYNW